MLEIVIANGQIYLEVLPNASYDRSESTLHLPIDAIVEHIEKNDGLISHKDVLISKQLDQNLLDEFKRVTVLVDLRHKEVSLQLLYELNFLDLLVAAPESFDKPTILLRAKRQALYLVNDELWPSRQAAHAGDLRSAEQV